MKSRNKIIIPLLAGTGTAFFFLIAAGLYLGPTWGKKIPHCNDPRKALLVIDIQEDYTGTTAKPPFPYKNSTDLIKKVNTAIEKQPVATMK